MIASIGAWYEEAHALRQLAYSFGAVDASTVGSSSGK